MAVADTLFTYGPSNVTSLLATTFSNMSPNLADNVYKAIPALAWLAVKKRVTADGGASILRSVIYAKNNTFAFYAGDDSIDVSIQDELTTAQYQWKQAASSISVTGRIELQNMGKSQVMDIVKSKTQSALLSVKDGINKGLWTSGITNEAQVGNQITPLATLINNTGTVGDINGGTSTWWQSIIQASGSFAARGLSDMRSVWNQINVSNPQGPADLILSDRPSYEAYESVLVPAVRISDTRLGDLGFSNLKYKEATWTFDINAIAGDIFLLNSGSLELVQHKERMFTLSEFIKPSNQDVRTAQVFWMGELTTDNRRKHGLLTGVTA
jgi:hypothetical protein